LSYLFRNRRPRHEFDIRWRRPEWDIGVKLWQDDPYLVVVPPVTKGDLTQGKQHDEFLKIANAARSIVQREKRK
jgi:hypothetical protein